MTLTAIEVATMLQSLVNQAQTTGLIPGGVPTTLVLLLATGLQTALTSGVLMPGTPIELDDIGMEFDAAMERMRAALAEHR